MFQFTGLAPPKWQQVFNLLGFPIRTSADRKLFALPRSFSQLVASFIASESQGIHRLLLLIFYSILSKISKNYTHHF